MDVTVKAKGDLQHHIVEDVAITLGKAISQALGDRVGIRRFGDAIVPMDDGLALAAVDLVKRPYSVVDLKLQRVMLEDAPREDLEHFFGSIAQALEATVHVKVLEGSNDHHKFEAAVKAFALALREAIAPDPRRAEDEDPALVKGLDVSGDVMRIEIFNYGAGNLFSIQAALKKEGAETSLTKDGKRLKDADALVLPGVGSFNQAAKVLPMQKIRDAVDSGKPLLGVCLGLAALPLEKRGGPWPRPVDLPGRGEEVPLFGSKGPPDRLEHALGHQRLGAHRRVGRGVMGLLRELILSGDKRKVGGRDQRVWGRVPCARER